MRSIFFIFLLLCGTLSAYPQHSPEISTSLKYLYRFAESRQLIEQAETLGHITIKAANLGYGASSAAWYPDARTICINFSSPRSLGTIIRSIVFEMHNVLSQKQFDHLDQLAMQGKISKEKYIQEVEYLEYLNAKKTAALLKNGVAQKVFPPDAYYSVAPTFEEHFHVQQMAGHSQFIGELWQSLKQNRKIL